MQLAIIKKLIDLLDINKFKALLTNRVMNIFDISFNQTNELNDFTTKPDSDAVKALEMREIILSDKMTDRLTGNLKFELLEGIKNNESIKEITARLDKIFVDVAPYELERIARTETLYAMNEGEYQSQVASGVAQFKIWKANINNIRTGADSKRLHNQIQPISEPFRDPLTNDECQHSPNRPNCRCLYGNPSVYTIDGWKRINKIDVDDLVLTHNGRFRKVTQTHKHSKKENKYHITVKFGNYNSGMLQTLIVTPDHPFLTNRGWVEAKDLVDSDMIQVMADECKNCGKLYPLIPRGKNKYLHNYCSIECGQSYTAKLQWDDPNIMKDVPNKISKSMKNQYESGERSKERSPEHLKNLIIAGTKALKSPEVRAKNWIYKPKEETEEIRDKIRQSSTGVHPSIETRKRQSDSKIKFYQEHPEKHPNYILAQKGHETNIEKLMRKELDNRNILYEKQYKIDRFFTDFAIPDLKIAIECDGEYWHQDKEKEKSRDNIIESFGWNILHFTGFELTNNIFKCVDSIERLMKNHNDEYKFMLLPIKSIEIKESTCAAMTWNLSIEEDESFISKGMVVHNCSIQYLYELPKNIIQKNGLMYLSK